MPGRFTYPLIVESELGTGVGSGVGWLIFEQNA